LQAGHWFLKAANLGMLLWQVSLTCLGFAPAQFNLAVCYMNGEGVLRDYQQGVLWYTKAAEQG
jgi:TPR repeat protein